MVHPFHGVDLQFRHMHTLDQLTGHGMLSPSPETRIACAAAAARLPPTATSRDPVDLLDKLCLRHKLRPVLQHLAN